MYLHATRHRVIPVSFINVLFHCPAGLMNYKKSHCLKFLILFTLRTAPGTVAMEFAIFSMKVVLHAFR